MWWLRIVHCIEENKTAQGQGRGINAAITTVLWIQDQQQTNSIKTATTNTNNNKHLHNQSHISLHRFSALQWVSTKVREREKHVPGRTNWTKMAFFNRQTPNLWSPVIPFFPLDRQESRSTNIFWPQLIRQRWYILWDAIRLKLNNVTRLNDSEHF